MRIVQSLPTMIQRQILAMGTLISVSLYGVSVSRARVSVVVVVNQTHYVGHYWHA